jgi:hypothetical protein
MSSAYRHGLRNKTYVGVVLNEAGTTITWVEVKKVQSVGNEDSREAANIVNRDGDTVKTGVGKRTLGWTLPNTWAPADPATVILWNAYKSGATIAFADMDGPIATNGSRGIFADVVVTGAPKPSELNGYDVREFTLAPSADSSFEAVEVIIGSPTTTTTGA